VAACNSTCKGGKAKGSPFWSLCHQHHHDYQTAQGVQRRLEARVHKLTNHHPGTMVGARRREASYSLAKGTVLDQLARNQPATDTQHHLAHLLVAGLSMHHCQVQKDLIAIALGMCHQLGLLAFGQ
jgi:hypothetical protein